MFCYDALMQWNLSDPDDKRPYMLLSLLASSENGEMVIKFLHETIQNKDASRFQLFFVYFLPTKFDERMNLPVSENGASGPALGLVPEVAMGSLSPGNLTQSQRPSTDNIRQYWLVNPRLTVFGNSLLALMREEGVTSDNAAIRTTSHQVVDALTQIEALEGENPAIGQAF